MTAIKERPRARTKTALREPTLARLVGFALLVLACWGTLLVIAAPASSDVPVLRSTSPGVGSTSRPDNLLLTFDRPVDAGLATVSMINPYRVPVELGRPTHPDGHTDTISVPIPKQKYAGTYSVSWSVPSGTLAMASGTFAFDLASRSPVVPPPELPTRPDVLVTVAHGIVLLGALLSFALLAGTALVAAVSPAGREDRLVGYAWLGATGFTALSLVTYGPYAARVPLTDAFEGGLLSGTVESAAGTALLARLVLLALGGIAVAALVWSEPAPTTLERRWRGATVLACTAAVAATWSLATPDVLVVDVVHGTAIAAVAAGLVVVCQRRPAPRAALVAVGAVVLTGGMELWMRHRGADWSLVAWVWIGKLVFTLGLVVTWYLGRRFARWRAVAAQAGISVLVAVATILVTVFPAVFAADNRTQAPPVRLAFDTAEAQGMLDLVVTPGKVGTNRIQVSVMDLGDASVDDFAVTAALNPPDGSASMPVALTRSDIGYSVGSVNIPIPGQWELALTVRSAGGKEQITYGIVDVAG